DLEAVQASRRLIALQPRAREVGLLGALSDRVAEREPDDPRRKIRREYLAEHAAEARGLGPDNPTGEASGPNQAIASRAVGQVAGLDANIGKRLGLRQLDRRLGVLNFLARHIEISSLGERASDRGIDVGRWSDD